MSAPPDLGELLRVLSHLEEARDPATAARMPGPERTVLLIETLLSLGFLDPEALEHMGQTGGAADGALTPAELATLQWIVAACGPRQPETTTAGRSQTRTASPADLERQAVHRIQGWDLHASPYATDLWATLDLAATQPDMALAKSRQILERGLHDLCSRHAVKAGTRPLEQLVRDLAHQDLLPRKLLALCEVVRELGNVGAHPIYDGEKPSYREVHVAFASLLLVLQWLHRTASEQPPVAIPGVTEPRTP